MSNHPKVTTIAEAFRLAAENASQLETEEPYVSEIWRSETYGNPAKAIAYTHADNIAEELTALAEEYEE